MPLDIHGETFQALARIGLALDDIDRGVRKLQSGVDRWGENVPDEFVGNVAVIRDAAAGLRAAGVRILEAEEPEVVAEVKDYIANAPEDDQDEKRREAEFNLAMRVVLDEIGV